MESEYSLPPLQKLVFCSERKPGQSSPLHFIQFLKILFSITFPSTIRSFSPAFSHQTPSVMQFVMLQI